MRTEGPKRNKSVPKRCQREYHSMTNNGGAATDHTPAHYPFWNYTAEMLGPDVDEPVLPSKAYRCVDRPSGILTLIMSIQEGWAGAGRAEPFFAAAVCADLPALADAFFATAISVVLECLICYLESCWRRRTGTEAGD